MKTMLVVPMVALLLVAFSGSGFAQSEVPHKTTLDFDDVLIEGSCKGPGLEITPEHVEKKFAPVLPLRKSFEKEARKSLETLK